MTFKDYAKLWGKNCELNEKRKNPFDVIFQEIDDMRDEKNKQQNKLNIHKEICNNLHETYKAKTLITAILFHWYEESIRTQF